MIRKACLITAAGALLAACGGAGDDEEGADAISRAEALAKEYLILDSHIDVPYRLEEEFQDVTQATEGGDFDYPRAAAGGLDIAFMSIYTPADYEFDAPGKAYAHAEKAIDLVEGIVARAPEKFAFATSPAQAEAAAKAGKIALPLGMENGAPIEGDLAKLKHFFDRGIRYVTPAHSLSNHIADSSYDPERPNEGLSDFGRKVIAEMNALGIMIDVSHLSDKAFWDVMEESDVSVLATHSSARHFTPGFERNMSDEMIRAMAAKGGVIMINFGSAFLTEEANQWGERRDGAYEAYLQETGQEGDNAIRDAFRADYRAQNPYPFADLKDVLDHIDHVVALTGVDHVGIGSDYDGVGNSLPTGLKDVSTYPNLVQGLIDRGYSDGAIEKILGGNALRVWRAVESYAKTVVGETEEVPSDEAADGSDTAQ